MLAGTSGSAPGTRSAMASAATLRGPSAARSADARTTTAHRPCSAPTAPCSGATTRPSAASDRAEIASTTSCTCSERRCAARASACCSAQPLAMSRRARVGDAVSVASIDARSGAQLRRAVQTASRSQSFLRAQTAASYSLCMPGTLPQRCSPPRAARSARPRVAAVMVSMSVVLLVGSEQRDDDQT